MTGSLKPDTLRQQAIAAGEVFLKDHLLAHGDYTVGTVSNPPSKYGIYSIRVVTKDTPEIEIKNAKALVIGCMDKRIAEPEYEEVLSLFGLKPEEILTLSVGGGIIQEDARREEALRKQIEYITKIAPGLKTIIASSHVGDSSLPDSGGCGGIKHFCSGAPLKDVIDRNVFPTEISATNAITPRHAYDVLNEIVNPDAKIRVWNVIPDETKQKIGRIDKLEMSQKSPRLRDICGS